eukprot:TRINITY_DN3514_c0_g1_i1.p1 TRINITY_DN3514_c0_g1~~TRINITY_DN3514_c0_g1_i1.p1  ORF type:complete len:366 (+),score=111.31 TRINITY_DN3514_c0_g1_i1:79-1176(+)
MGNCGSEPTPPPKAAPRPATAAAPAAPSTPTNSPPPKPAEVPRIDIAREAEEESGATSRRSSGSILKVPHHSSGEAQVSPDPRYSLGRSPSKSALRYGSKKDLRGTSTPRIMDPSGVVHDCRRRESVCSSVSEEVGIGNVSFASQTSYMQRRKSESGDVVMRRRPDGSVVVGVPGSVKRKGSKRSTRRKEEQSSMDLASGEFGASVLSYVSPSDVGASRDLLPQVHEDVVAPTGSSSPRSVGRLRQIKNDSSMALTRGTPYDRSSNALSPMANLNAGPVSPIEGSNSSLAGLSKEPRRIRSLRRIRSNGGRNSVASLVSCGSPTSETQPTFGNPTECSDVEEEIDVVAAVSIGGRRKSKSKGMKL